MIKKSWLIAVALATSAGAYAQAGAFGKVVPIGGHAADLALDEGRGVLYIANFTANRIEVMSLATQRIQRSINVAPQPASLSLSPDGKYLVAVHFGNFSAPAVQQNAITIINLESDSRQTLALGNPPLGVAFGIDNRALIVTSKEFVLLDPLLGSTEVVATIPEVVTKVLPAPPATFPNTIKSASVGASGDLQRIFVFGDGITFRYDVGLKRIVPGSFVFGGGTVGPRVVSANQNGSRWMGAWFLIDTQSTIVSWIERTTQNLDVGTSVFDNARGLIYAQILGPGETAASQPVLRIMDNDNLYQRSRIRLPENFAGRSVLTADGNTMIGVSDSGVMVLPIGQLNTAPRVVAEQEDLVFRGNFCDRSTGTQLLTIVDPSGGNTPFRLTTTQSGIRISPASGVTPATVRVSADPAAFGNTKGTVSATINIVSDTAVNLPSPVRVLINSREPDQRGSFVSVAGTVSDILADPSRDRFFVLRRSHNDVLVFDGGNFTQTATLRTGNTPSSMAITFDRRYLLVSNESSWIISVYDLETLEPLPYIRVGMSPHSVAVASDGILIHGVDHQNKGWILRGDLSSRTATELSSLGIFENGNLQPSGKLTASPNGANVLYAQPDGTVILYSAVQGTFTAARKDTAALAGALAASSFDQFVVGNRLLNSSLVLSRTLESATGQSSGFVFVDDGAIRFTAQNSSSPGILQRVNLTTGDGIRPTRTIEAPLLSSTENVFPRTLAPLYSRNGLVALTTSGFTVIPWNYDLGIAPPRIERVVNAADFTQPVAVGGLVTVFGQNLSPVNQASRQIPLPTALGDSCLTVNGVAVPVLFVSPRQVNAQLPFAVDGNTVLRLNTPGGVSDNFNIQILNAAPSVFRTNLPGADGEIPTVLRAVNNLPVTPSNPVHRGDVLTIYATGLGRTTPSVDVGLPAPSDTLAEAVIAPSVTIGGVPVDVTFAGLTPGFVGVYQINVNVGGGVPLGLNVPLVISQGGSATTLDVRVVE